MARARTGRKRGVEPIEGNFVAARILAMSSIANKFAGREGLHRRRQARFSGGLFAPGFTRGIAEVMAMFSTL